MAGKPTCLILVHLPLHRRQVHQLPCSHLPTPAVLAGVMLWELYHSQTCYKAQPNGGFLQREHFPSFPRRSPPDYVQLAAACMAQEPPARPTFSDVVYSLQVGVVSVAASSPTARTGW